jgi:membrane associated rhomboid family serine protease
LFPLKDDLPARATPLVTVSIISVNALVFLYQMSLQIGISIEADNPAHAVEAARAFVLEFGLVPCRLTGLCAYPDVALSPVFTIFSSMFLHGGLFHIAGNMLYLWIFGNNVEDTLGHARFALFYLLSGVTAAVRWPRVGRRSSRRRAPGSR